MKCYLVLKTCFYRWLAPDQEYGLRPYKVFLDKDLAEECAAVRNSKKGQEDDEYAVFSYYCVECDLVEHPYLCIGPAS